MSWLLLDIGNSRCKAVISDGKSLEWLVRFSWDNQEFDEEHWQAQLQKVKNDYSQVGKILISSVSSDSHKSLVRQWCQQVFGLTPIFAQSSDLYEAEHNDLVNSYDEPSALGVDRWLAMIGAFERTDKAFAVLDAGTAITLDLVNNEGAHLGGHIVPGAKLMQKALFGDTGKIAFGAHLDSTAANEKQWLGVNSLQAVELGTYQAASGYLQTCLERLSSHYDIESIYICGGDGVALMNQVTLPKGLNWVDSPDLIFEGLFYWQK